MNHVVDCIEVIGAMWIFAYLVDILFHRFYR